ncbi:MAG: hypothetical protein CVV59_00770 [Tenericutes bacterium HGW-Tenericutes-4]|nr:MAG: hypothetical protein CVV59_00770 [Tenericutes bacterium HGW-Tenericutes-4]
MKKKSIILCFVLMLVLLPSYFIKEAFTVEAQEQKFEKKITLTGMGEIISVPNVATISLGIETISENLELAQNENKVKINKLIEALLEYGIKKENIKTTQFNVYEQWDYSSSRKRIGYNVTNVLQLETSELENLGNVITLATKNGANLFHNVAFSIKEKDSLYNAALKKAFENAQDKFYSLIGADATINNIQIIEEPQYSYTPMYTTFEKAASYRDDNFLLAGQTPIKAVVRVIISY